MGMTITQMPCNPGNYTAKRTGAVMYLVVYYTGAHDAYNLGDKVSYNGKHYICTSDANAYAPDVYGWEESA